MTEDEWLECADVSELVQVKGERSQRNVPCTTNERKLRLFACACCRHIWHLLIDPRSRAAVLVGEQIADGEATTSQRAAALRLARDASSDIDAAHWNADWDSLKTPSLPAASAALLTVVEGDTQFDPDTPYLPDADQIALDCRRAVALAGGPAAVQAEAASQVAMFHDIMGNPFRPVQIDRSSLTDEVLQLALSIYTGRRFDRLPELSKTLERVGCTNREILDHCGKPGLHVRGCWVIDLLLGKA